MSASSGPMTRSSSWLNPPRRATCRPPNIWRSRRALAVNSIAVGGLLFLLCAGFSLIFGLMRIPNLMHGSFFMLGAYFGVSLLDERVGLSFWLAALASGLAMA